MLGFDPWVLLVGCIKKRVIIHETIIMYLDLFNASNTKRRIVVINVNIINIKIMLINIFLLQMTTYHPLLLTSSADVT